MFNSKSVRCGYCGDASRGFYLTRIYEREDESTTDAHERTRMWRSRSRSSADFSVCCIAGFSTCWAGNFNTLRIFTLSRSGNRRYSRLGNLRYEFSASRKIFDRSSVAGRGSLTRSNLTGKRCFQLLNGSAKATLLRVADSRSVQCRAAAELVED